MVAEKWKQMNEEEKSKYVQLAEHDKERYKKEMEQFAQKSKTQQPLKKKKKIIIKIKKSGSEYYERFRLVERTFEELTQKILSKFPSAGKINSILNVPDVRITDTEGVKCLKSDAELIVSFK